MTARARRHTIARYRIRRFVWEPFSPDTYEAPMVYFIYDFDHHVVSLDKPRMRFARLWSMIRRPSVLLGPVPRKGALRPWFNLSRELFRRLDLKPESVRRIALERFTKEGWKIRATFHIEKGTVVYLPFHHLEPEPELFKSLAAASAVAFKSEEIDVRPFLYGLGDAILAAQVSFILTTASALLFPLTVGLLGDFLQWSTRSEFYFTSRFLVITLLLIAAYGFFRLKLSRQRFYGSIELGVGIGMMFAAISTSQPSHHLDLALKTMAAVYVVIRGCTNVNEAIAKERAKLGDEAKEWHASIKAEE